MLDIPFCHINPQTVSILKASNEMDATLLITGNTGTGKSHLALAVHRASQKRGTTRLSKINLATLSENLIESELFGHEKGAFTGAEFRRVGKLEACNGGAVFLDEIGELPLRLQSKLLDFIQYRKISPVGSNREIDLDVRVIAATNRNLTQAVKAGEFREDLFHRMNVFHIKMPGLSENPNAIFKFAKTFLQNKAKRVEKRILGFSEEVERAFEVYGWPGNIRELENVIEFAVGMEQTDRILLGSLPMYLQELNSEQVAMPLEECRPRATGGVLGTLELPMSLDFHKCKDDFEKTYLEQALRYCSGQINLTSRSIGLNKVSLAEKIRKHSIDWKKIRTETMGPKLTQTPLVEPDDPNK